MYVMHQTTPAALHPTSRPEYAPFNKQNGDGHSLNALAPWTLPCTIERLNGAQGFFSRTMQTFQWWGRYFHSQSQMFKHCNSYIYHVNWLSDAQGFQKLLFLSKKCLVCVRQFWENNINFNMLYKWKCHLQWKFTLSLAWGLTFYYNILYMIDFLILETITNSLEWENTLLDRAPSLRQSCSLSSLKPLCSPAIVVPSCVTTSAGTTLPT